MTNLLSVPPVDVVALGEVLVDLIPSRGPGRPYQACPGGAPANVAVGLARLGRRVAMVSRVGTDDLAGVALSALVDAGVDVRNVARDDLRPTTLTVVQPLRIDAERFVMYRQGAADEALTVDDVPFDEIAAAQLLHLGSLTLASPASRAASMAAVELANVSGTLVSVDVNLRPTIWRDDAAMLAAAQELAATADVLKVTREELSLLGGDVALALPRRLLLVTDGPDPACGQVGDLRLSRTPPATDVADTAGSGDAFMAAVLDCVLGLEPGRALQEMTAAELGEALDRGVIAGSAAATAVGATAGLAELSAMVRSA